MKQLNITSTVEFKLKDRIEDVLAKELFDVERNLGSRFTAPIKITNVEKANEYVNYQMSRLVKYAKEDQIEKFDFLAKILLKKSDSYLIYALNHTYSKFEGMNVPKLLDLILEVRQLALSECEELKYKRIWIDKIEGDYGRPLGVPEAAHRIYGHMITRIIEAYFEGTGQYSDHQHGGRSGKGTLTFLSTLGERIKSASRIFEFDIKGYFDHISHDAIIKLFKSKVIIKYLTGALKSKPESFTLPPVSEDEAIKTHERIMDTAVDIQPVSLEEFLRQVDQEGSFVLNNDEELTEYIHNPIEVEHRKKTKLEEKEGEVNEKDVKFYKQALWGENVIFVNGEFITKSSREQGRDSWKDLDLEDQGVPQGSSFGPIVASVLLGKIFPKDSLIYMDDGLIFLTGNDNRTKGDMIRYLNNLLIPLKCEIAPNKSRLLRTYDLMTEGFKIVGTRWTQKRSYFNYTVSSETRKGIKRKLFPHLKENYLEILGNLYSQGYISTSKHKVLRWYLKGDRFTKVCESQLFGIADKIGILGSILSKAYSPTTSLTEMKEQIEYAIMKSEIKMRSSRGTLGSKILEYPGMLLLETTEGKVHVKPTIFNTRAIANDILLRYLKGELPIRKLRTQGMKYPSKVFHR